MIVKNIVYDDKFLKEFGALPKNISEKSITKLELFENNPFHPSLRLHRLS